ncbi:hypothetical protein RBB75_18300 [Tunturibacter empetritectus]|uniref:tRNA_anti-like n=1 Tax=Tunturiibacter empetritectus TaxID=3069691 RepID=A0AAU7ZBX1_9BACT
MPITSVQRSLWIATVLLSFFFTCSPEFVGAQSSANQQDVQPIGMKALFDAAANPLGWRQLAGKTVGLYGGQFFNIAEVGNARGKYLISLRSSQYSTDVVSCLISDDTMSTAATFKPNDPVVMIGRLAGSPHDRTPAFDGSCYVASGKKPQGASTADVSGPLAPEVTTTLDKFSDEASANSVAFGQKYTGKVVQLSGGYVGRIDPNYFVVYYLAGPRKFPLDGINCMVQPSEKAKIGSLKKDQTITITGMVKDRNENRTANLAPILDNCTFQ